MKMIQLKLSHAWDGEIGFAINQLNMSVTSFEIHFFFNSHLAAVPRTFPVLSSGTATEHLRQCIVDLNSFSFYKRASESLKKVHGIEIHEIATMDQRDL